MNESGKQSDDSENETPGGPPYSQASREPTAVFGKTSAEDNEQEYEHRMQNIATRVIEPFRLQDEQELKDRNKAMIRMKIIVLGIVAMSLFGLVASIGLAALGVGGVLAVPGLAITSMGGLGATLGIGALSLSVGVVCASNALEYREQLGSTAGSHELLDSVRGAVIDSRERLTEIEEEQPREILIKKRRNSMDKIYEQQQSTIKMSSQSRQSESQRRSGSSISPAK